jgi:hypothetical protein
LADNWLTGPGVTDFQKYLETVKPLVEDALSSALSNSLGGLTIKSTTAFLSGLKGGKKIRGCLSCMLNEALGGVRESAISRAIAVELIQAATLIHDDFVDQDIVRRNMPATWTLEGARKAVLIGDVIFSTAIEMMTDLSKEDGSAVSRAIAEMSRGALYEPLDLSELIRDVESQRLDKGLYPKIIRLKTAVLFGTACQLGAISAGAGSELTEASYRYGVLIGEAYQMADDAQEVASCMSQPSIEPEEMIALSPAFLYFLDDARTHILKILKDGCIAMKGLVKESFVDIADHMKTEIEHRLQSAVAEIDRNYPKNCWSDLVRRAPRDIINMFNES